MIESIIDVNYSYAKTLLIMDKTARIKYVVAELIGQGNVDIVDTAFTTDYIAHAENKTHSGRTFIKRFEKLLHTVFPDISVLEVKVLAQEDNTITWQRTLQGTHKENMMGILPSHKVIKWNEMVVSRFKGDKIAEEWIVSELLGQLLLKQ